MLHFSPQELERCRVSLARLEGQTAAAKAAQEQEAGSWGSWAFGAT